MIKLSHFLFVIGCSLASIYVFPSGNPQPADIINVFFILVVFFNAFLTGQTGALFRLPKEWGALVFWVVLVSLCWSIILQSPTMMRNALFWIYNFLFSMALFYILHKSERGKDVVVFSICCSLIVSCFGVISTLGGSSRSTGFFNNPNQLAFFSLLGISSLIILVRFQIYSRLLVVVAIVSGVVGIFASGSLSAMAGLVLVVTGFLLANLKILRFVKVVLGFLFVSSLISSFAGDYLTTISDNLAVRFTSAESKVENAYTQRNYDRILAFPEYAVLGAGEGHLYRFYPHDELEIHSSFGNILFAYGVLGITLLLGILWSVMRKAPVSACIVIAGPLLYSVTHMGLRTTAFWMLITIAWYEYKDRRLFDGD